MAHIRSECSRYIHISLVTIEWGRLFVFHGGFCLRERNARSAREKNRSIVNEVITTRIPTKSVFLNYARTSGRFNWALFTAAILFCCNSFIEWCSVWANLLSVQWVKMHLRIVCLLNWKCFFFVGWSHSIRIILAILAKLANCELYQSIGILARI